MPRLSSEQNSQGPSPALKGFTCYCSTTGLFPASLGWAILACPDLRSHILESATFSDTWKLALQPLLGVEVCDWRRKAIYSLDNTFMTIWEYFSEAVKCNSSVLLQNCQLISEEMQNTNKPALFASSMPYCSAEFREAAASTIFCNDPADSSRRWLQGFNAFWRKKSHVEHRGEIQRWKHQATGNTVWSSVGDTQLSAKNGHRPASSRPCPQRPSQTHTLWSFLLSHLLHGLFCPLQQLHHDLPESFSSQGIYLFARITPCCSVFAGRF